MKIFQRGIRIQGEMVYEDRARGMDGRLGLCNRIIAVELCDCNAGMRVGLIFFWKLDSLGKRGVGWFVCSMDF